MRREGEYFNSEVIARYLGLVPQPLVWAAAENDFGGATLSTLELRKAMSM